MNNGLKNSAMNYFLKGLNIIPVNGKHPLIQWDNWQDKKQTEKDFESLPWQLANGFALIGGSQLDNGLFVGAMDFDVKNTSFEAQQKAKDVMKHLPITQIEETVSGGQHWIYFSREKPKTVSVYHKICALELLGENRLIIMAPSEGYKRINDNEPTIVDDLESLFYDSLKKNGIIQSEKFDVWFEREFGKNKLFRSRSKVH